MTGERWSGRIMGLVRNVILPQRLFSRCSHFSVSKFFCLILMSLRLPFPSLRLSGFSLLIAIWSAMAIFVENTADAASAEKLRVLVVTGGHGFEREPFFKMFEDNPDITFTAAEHSKTNASVYDRTDLPTYDVVVLYDMPKDITEAQKKNFLSLFEKGAGLVVLHHALVSYPNWPEYDRIIGGRYPEPDPKRPGTVTDQAGYQHDVDIPVVILATNHPITDGLTNFTINDEIYWGFRVAPDVTPLFTTTQPKSGKPLAWTRTEGKSRVVYMQLGHGPSAFNNPNYRKLLAQSIQWAANRPATERTRPGFTPH